LGNPIFHQQRFSATSVPTPVAPIPAFIGAPLSGTIPTTVTFTNQSTGTYTSVLWDFGDGSTSTSSNPSHVYLAAGSYDVTLTLYWSGTPVSLTKTTYVSVSAPVSSPFSTIGFDAQTPEQISIYCPTLRTPAAGTTVTVRYKAVAASTWNTGHPLLYVNPALVPTGGPAPVVENFAGVIFDLTPGTTYDVELTIHEPGYSDVVLATTRSTRSLPAAAGAATKTATISDNLQTKVDSLVPGDVLVLAAGVYNRTAPLVINVSGTAGSPIYIRGASRNTVNITNPNGAVIYWNNANHVILEDMTLTGTGIDSGLTADSRGVIFNDAYAQVNPTIRRVTITGVDIGIKAYIRVLGALVYDCTLTGNNTWDKTWTPNPAAPSNYPNWTWNDDGICIPGQGNFAFNNTLTGFGDTFASYGNSTDSILAGSVSAAVFFARNRVNRGGDDVLEADDSTRNIALYDTWIANTGTLISFDAIYGGPVYYFRNIVVNYTRFGVKFSSHAYGTLGYNNTFLKTDNGPYKGDFGFEMQFSDPAQYAIAFVNNVIVYEGPDATFQSDTVVDYVDWHHNGWYSSNMSFNWLKSPGGNFATPALAAAGLGSRNTLFDSLQRQVSDVILEANPFNVKPTLGADFSTEYTSGPVDMSLKSTSTGKNTGYVVAGITDGYSGAAPDMGAIISGRASVAWGDQNNLSLNLVGSVWTPNRDGTGNVIQSDFDALPTLQWIEVAGTNTTLRSVQELPTLPSGTSAPDNNSLTDPWCGAAWDSSNKRMILQGGGHGDGHPCSNAIFEVSAAKMKCTRLVDRTSTSQLQAYNIVSKLFENWSGSTYAYYGVSWPLKNGHPSSAHTYHGLEYIPPATMSTLGYPGNVNGGLLTTWPYNICNLDTGDYAVPWWTSDSDTPGPHFDSALGWALKFRDGTKCVFVTGDFTSGLINLATPSTSRWSAEISGGNSFCTVTIPYSHPSFKRADSLIIKFQERRELACIHNTVKSRMKIGTALDAGATDFTPYTDTITLTSLDGSHADFNSTNLAESAGGSSPAGFLNAAGTAYDHATGTVWIQGNDAGTCLYRITGISGTTWTVTKYTGTTATYGENGVNGNYHRFGVATFGSVKVLIRITGVDHPIQVCRVL